MAENTPEYYDHILPSDPEVGTCCGWGTCGTGQIRSGRRYEKGDQFGLNMKRCVSSTAMWWFSKFGPITCETSYRINHE